METELDSEEHLQRGSFTSFNETPLDSICKNQPGTAVSCTCACPPPGGALAEGFQARMFEFQNFERRFEVSSKYESFERICEMVSRLSTATRMELTRRLSIGHLIGTLLLVLRQFLTTVRRRAGPQHFSS